MAKRLNENVKDHVIPIYRDRSKTLEAWANINTGKVEYGDHNGNPSNTIFTSSRSSTSPSEAYRNNYDLIKWEKK